MQLRQHGHRPGRFALTGGDARAAADADDGAGPPGPAALAPERPVLLKLDIARFRGIEALSWRPDPGVNIIIGGGNVGKSTILDAIGLLLGPTNSTIVTDTDYWRRAPEAEFLIEAVMRLPAGTGINDQRKSAWPWHWDGEDAQQPDMEAEAGAEQDPVYIVRVRGTADCDLAYEIRQPGGEIDHFPVGVRRSIGLVRLAGDDRNDRDLRLIQGSALDRLLADRTLRAKLARELGEEQVDAHLAEAAKAKLAALDTLFGEEALPVGLGLGLVGGQGFSLNALIGLTARKDGYRLPLGSWGSGTRRLAALEIAAANHGQHPVTIVDEIERGLEPYRQRILVQQLVEEPSQSFVTTHSGTALAVAAAAARIWYLSGDRTIGALEGAAIRHLERDPEAFLSRLTIIAEGVTEVGFCGYLLQRAFGTKLWEHGIWIANASGNSAALGLFESLLKGGLRFAGFVDDEGDAPQRWKKIVEALGDRLLRWPAGCLEANVIAHVDAGDLEAFIADRDGHSGRRLRTLADRLGLEDKSFSAIAATTGDLRALIIDAASGSAPEDMGADERKVWQSHGKAWFKSKAGGMELAEKMFAFGVWPKLAPQLLAFINAVRGAVDLPALAQLPE